MHLLYPFDPVHAAFPDQGNLIGVFDRTTPVHLPDSERRFRPLVATGSGAALHYWMASQMVQDFERGADTVVCLDPKGRIANAFTQRLDKRDAKRVCWIDLDAPFEGGRTAERVIPLNPCDPFDRHDERDFQAFKDQFLETAGSLAGDTWKILEFTLKAFALNRCHEADRAFTLSGLLTFCADAAYRRYILSGLHPALLRDLPESSAFQRTYPAIARHLRPVFAEPVWRATLAGQTSSAFQKLPAAPIIIVTGEALISNTLPASIWRHAFFRHLRHLMDRDGTGETLHLYGCGGKSLDDPGIDALVSLNPKSTITVTLARDAYGYDGNTPRLFFDREIAFDIDARQLGGNIYARTTDDLLFKQPSDRGGSFSLTLPLELRAPNAALPEILRRSSVYRYGRKLTYPLLETDRLLTGCQRGDAIYDALDIPAPFGWRARLERDREKIPRKSQAKKRTLVDNPFVRKFKRA